MAKLASDIPASTLPIYREISRAIRQKVVNLAAKTGFPAKKLPNAPMGLDEGRWPHAKPHRMV